MSFFKKKKRSKPVEESPGGNGEGSFVFAKRQYADNMAGLVWSNRAWQYLALTCLLVTMAAVGGVVVMGTQSRLVPYVVEVDKLGQTASVGRADRAAVADERLIKAALASFVMDAKRVSFDGNMQNDAIWRVFSKLKEGDPGLVKMRAFMTDPNTAPTKRAETETVDVEVVNILQQAERNWEITWMETAWNRAGQQVRRNLFRGLFSIYFVPPTSSTTEKEVFRNPLGLFVKDFSWGKMVE